MLEGRIGQNKKNQNYYSQSNINFMEAINWINNQEEVHEFAQLTDKFVFDRKRKYQIRLQTLHKILFKNLNLDLIQ